MSYQEFEARKRTNNTVYSKFWHLSVSKYKLFLIQFKINNSHYHPNTYRNVLLQ